MLNEVRYAHTSHLREKRKSRRSGSGAFAKGNHVYCAMQEGNHVVLPRILERNENIEGVVGTVQFPFLDPMQVEDLAGRVEALGEGQQGLLVVLDGSSAVGDQLAGQIMDGNGQPSP